MSTPQLDYNPPPIRFNRYPNNFEEIRKSVQDIGGYLGQLQDKQVNYFRQLFNTINNAGQGFGPDLASAATISPTSTIHVVTGTNTVSQINIPPGFNGPLYLISHDGFSVTTGDNIAQAAAVPATSLLVLVYVPQTALFYITAISIPANSITTAMLQNGAVTGAKIAASTITAGNIAALTITTGLLAADAITANGSIVNNSPTSITTSDVALGTFTVNVNDPSDVILISGSISTTASNYAATGSITVTSKLWRNATIVGGNVTAGTLLNSWPGFLNASTTPTLAGEGAGSPNWNDTGVSGSNSYTFSMTTQAGPTISVVQLVAIAIDFKR